MASIAKAEQVGGEVGGARTFEYESAEDLAKYLALHFSEPDDSNRLVEAGILHENMRKGFVERIYETVEHYMNSSGQGDQVAGRKALDLGCAVGGLCFQLAQTFETVVGIDVSQSFIRAANQLKEGQTLSYQLVEEGRIARPCEYRLPGGLLEKASRCSFLVGDACAVSATSGLDTTLVYDCVIMCNLLCRVPTPRHCLNQLTEGPGALLAPGGLLFLMTPCSWSFAFTKQEEWLGGYPADDGSHLTTFEAVRSFLSPHFSLLHCGHLPLLIRFHSRKFELIISQLSVWKKNSA